MLFRSDQNGCISEDMLLEYAAGKLSPDQVHHVEKHLLECELCSDALEGLKMIQESKSKKLIADINREIDNRLQSAGKPGAGIIPFRFDYRIAAVIALLILFGSYYLFFMTGKEEKMMAENQAAVSTSATDSVSQQTPPRSDAAQNPVTTSASQPKQEAAKMELPAAQNANSSSKQADEQEARAESKNKATDLSTEKDEVAMSQTKTTAPAQEQVREISGAAPAAMENSGTISDAKKEVANDGQKNLRIAQQDLFSMNVLFTKGKNNYKQKKFAEAAIDFEKLMNDNTTSFYDDAKWMLAN